MSVLVVVFGCVGLLAGLIAVLILVLWHYQERVVFQPPRLSFSPPQAPGTGYRVYSADDGQRLYGYLVGGASHDQRTVIAFHGNADVAQWLLPWAHELHRRSGAQVLLAEYRGYGGLAGRPSYTATRLDALAAVTMVRSELGVPPSELVVFGHSLGSAVAAEVATLVPCSTLILQSPFSSARAMAAHWFFPGTASLWDRVSRIHFDTCARVAALSVPVHVVHGERDLVVPVAMGRQVYASARLPGRLLIIPHAGHNDVAERGEGEYWRWLTMAIARIG